MILENLVYDSLEKARWRPMRTGRHHNCPNPPALATRADALELEPGPHRAPFFPRTFALGQAPYGGPGEFPGGASGATCVPADAAHLPGAPFGTSKPLRRRAIGPLADENPGTNVSDEKLPSTSEFKLGGAKGGP